MKIVAEFLPYIQIILSVLLVILILLQRSDADLGGAFGGGDAANGAMFKRRGLEKIIFNSTIVIGIIFGLSALLALIIR